jgi:FAD/FMN-containing dehydrogenase/Fe-S oxidoreductase
MTRTGDDKFQAFGDALRQEGFGGDVEDDSALRAAVSTDNSVYQIFPDLVVAPRTSEDVVLLLRVLEEARFADIALTPRGAGTGTNGQSLNRGVIVDMRRYMNRLLAVNPQDKWADVEPGIVLDDLNEQLRRFGLFFAPETSTSSRCTVGGMVSTDASGKGSRVYGKTSDNVLGLEVAQAEGLLSSWLPAPEWALPTLAAAERAARRGRAAFMRNTPAIARRFTGYDLERACPDSDGFQWWRLFPGSEGTLGPITRIRVKLRPLESEKRLVVAAFSSFRQALDATTPLLVDEPTAIEIMDEHVQKIAENAGVLARLPRGLRSGEGKPLAYVFVEFNGDDAQDLTALVGACETRLRRLAGIGAVYVATEQAEIRQLWAVRSASVGLLGKVDGPARPVAFVEDCVVPPENLADFVHDFTAVLQQHGLDFAMYGHVDVGCLHIRPALNIDAEADRAKLVSVSDAVFGLTRKYGGIFWGEHGKGVRGAYLADWIGPEAYAALQGVKAAFDPRSRFNPGKLVSQNSDVMGIATTGFRKFNADPGDKLEKAFRCNGNAQCLSYAAATPMCPSFKASNDIRHSPKGRADALRAWKSAHDKDARPVEEEDLLAVLDTCLGCKACASTCPVQVDIPRMRTAFYARYYAQRRRPLTDRLLLLAERVSPLLAGSLRLARPFWPLMCSVAEMLIAAQDLPKTLARPLPARNRVSVRALGKRRLPANAVLVWQDWFTALFDEGLQRDALAGLEALGYLPLFVEMLPSGKAALNLGDLAGFRVMALDLSDGLARGAARGTPMIGLDPAYVMMLRQDYPAEGLPVPEVLLPQEFLAREIRQGRIPARPQTTAVAKLFSHCTEVTGFPEAPKLWAEVFSALGLEIETPSTGCCGMAGVFGHQKRHQHVSRRLYEMSWRDHVAAAKAPVLATGFSCRCQIERLSGAVTRHPLGYIADLLAPQAAP